MGPRPRALVLERVTKRFSRGGRAIEVVRDLSLALEGGRIVGLLGANGAGKTTLLRMVAGLVEPTSGEILLRGRSLRGAVGALQRDIGWCSSDERSFYPRLSGFENLRLFSVLQGLDRKTARTRIAAYAERFGLNGILEKPFQACSTGQRQRLNLVRAMLHEPAILLLDEPARSLDAAARTMLVEHLCEIAAHGDRLVLVASHDLEGLERLWSDVAVLHAGRLAYVGPAAELMSAEGEPTWEVAFDTHAARDRAIARFAGLRAGASSEVAVCTATDGALPAAVRACATSAGPELVRLERRARPSLRARLAEIAEGKGPDVAPALFESIAARATDEPAPLRPRPPMLRAAFALARRDRLVYLSHHFQTGLKLALLVVWIATLYFVSRLIDTNASEVARHLSADYFTFALVGLAGLRITQVCLVQMASALREEQLQGTVEPLLATGEPPILLLFGGLLWPLLSDIAGLVVVFGAAGLLLGADFSAANAPAACVAGIASVIASALWGVLSASFVIAFKRGDPVTLLFNLVTIGLSGVFFPVELIPAWLRPVSQVLPLTWGLEAVRAAVLRGEGFTSAEYRHALAGLCLLIAVIAPVAWWAYRAAVAHARRTGSLAQS